MATHKTCIACKITKPLSAFWKDSSRKGGYRPRCVQCMNQGILTCKPRHVVHGMAYTPIYMTWKGMMRRCNTPTDKDYYLYGAKGITVCQRWHDVKNFHADMGNPPPGRSIDRIDNTGNYEPSNCRWATVEQQSNNKSTSRFLTFNGQTLTIAQWAKQIGVSKGTLRHRITAGWSVEKALTTPKQKYRGK